MATKPNPVHIDLTHIHNQRIVNGQISELIESKRTSSKPAYKKTESLHVKDRTRI